MKFLKMVLPNSIGMDISEVNFALSCKEVAEKDMETFKNLLQSIILMKSYD